MSTSDKPMSQRDGQQTLQLSFNDVDNSLTSSGFLTGLLGRKITQTISTTTVTGDTSVISFYEGATLLYTLTIVYTDATQAVFISATRTA